MAALDPRQLALKEEFTRNRGYWSPVWDGVLALSPDFFEAYMNFSSVPWKTGPLEPKIKELIYVAIDAATTHLYDPGLRIHIRNALRHGATKEEIMEVYQITSCIGIHTCSLGIPLLLDELGRAGRKNEIDRGPLDTRQEQLKAEWITHRGYWNERWDAMLRLSPEFFEAYLNFSAVPWKHGTLAPKIKELIYVAIDASTTHLYEPGLKTHIANALRHGATPAEIMEVFELTSVLGIHTCTMGVPALFDEIERAEKEVAAERTA